MTTQILNNLSLASLPVIIGAIVIGLGLTGLLLWIISRGRPHQSTDIQTAALFSKIDLLQAERQRCDADHANGSISADEYANACHDIDRRLLGLSTEMDRLGQTGTSILTPRNISISLLVPALSLVIYLGIGNPQSPDRPFASRSAEITAAKAGASQNQNAAATALRDAIKATEASPNDVEAWLLLAQAAANVNDNETEIRALRTAIDITKGDIAITSMLAEALSRAADGQVTIPARALIKTVLEADPAEPRALFLAGLAAFQDGDYAIAIGQWQALLAVSNPDAPWVTLVRENMQRAAEAGNITLPPEQATAAPAGPDAQAMADAANMTEAERDEMIASMVKRLEDRLVETPDDTDGWVRLARAYDVLGQNEKALEALANAARSAPDDLDVQLSFLELILASGTTSADITRATAALAAAKKIAPNNPQTLFFEGHLARLAGDNATARIAWTALLKLMTPDSGPAKALEAEINKLN
ncbi:MAG: c-type cytochrome biogenesis protein CcmI [Alphaproteobacteria bacterium]|nr:c-type cytochrome biogenesis protein CcmI [Alphaproteobacteria bacterium]